MEETTGARGRRAADRTDGREQVDEMRREAAEGGLYDIDPSMLGCLRDIG